MAIGSKQVAKAKDEEDVTMRGEKNKAEHEDPIVELKDMPDLVPTPQPGATI